MAQKKNLLRTLETAPLKSEVPLTPDGLFSTMNKMGYMTSELDCFSKKMLAFLPLAKPILDVGAAYGVATLPFLNTGAHVIANDLCTDHLKIIEKRCPLDFKKRLTFRPGSFPDQVDFEPNSLSAVYTARVFHFFKGDIIEQALEKIASWLEPGGLFMLISETPYLGDYKSFIPVFEQRKKDGHPWPGEIEDISVYAPYRLENLPQSFNLLDPDTLRIHLEKRGFTILDAQYIDRPDFPADLRLDGRESMGILARKT